jgi:hypothetical protein
MRRAELGAHPRDMAQALVILDDTGDRGPGAKPVERAQQPAEIKAPGGRVPEQFQEANSERGPE